MASGFQADLILLVFVISVLFYYLITLNKPVYNTYIYMNNKLRFTGLFSIDTVVLVAIGLGGASFLVIVITAICCCIRFHRTRDTPAPGISPFIIAFLFMFY